MNFWFTVKCRINLNNLDNSFVSGYFCPTVRWRMRRLRKIVLSRRRTKPGENGAMDVAYMAYVNDLWSMVYVFIWMYRRLNIDTGNMYIIYIYIYIIHIYMCVYYIHIYICTPNIDLGMCIYNTAALRLIPALHTPPKKYDTMP